MLDSAYRLLDMLYFCSLHLDHPLYLTMDAQHAIFSAVVALDISYLKPYWS